MLFPEFQQAVIMNPASALDIIHNIRQLRVQDLNRRCQAFASPANASDIWCETAVPCQVF
jgi:hypothetical protein